MEEAKTKQPAGNEPENMAALLGKTFALVQHGMDKVIEWGFSKIKDIPKEGGEKKIENPALRNAAKAGRGVLRFFGGMGKAYYEYYEELKKHSKTN